ncbi:MAG TPA: glycerophosphodiester phosphodiesterase [Bacillota bacterium]|nr:glycerophosphodiester phosphodiesterase [Bacillota bacterium]
MSKKKANSIFLQDDFLIFSHRGGLALYPENTMYAFKQSVKRFGADVLELDVHMTSDGQIVVIHDETLDRTTNGSGRVREMGLAQVKRLDAGHSFTTDGGKTYPCRNKGLTVPSLGEVFSCFSDRGVGINIEIKRPYPHIEKKLYKLILSHRMTDRVLVNSGYPLVLRRFRRLNKAGICTGADFLDSLRAFTLSRLKLYKFYKTAADALQLPLWFKGRFRVVTGDMVELCKQKKLKLHVWTINSIKDMEKLIDLGVDGIMTDYPNKLYRLNPKIKS